MLVHTAAHVVDLHVHNVRTDPTDAVGLRLLLDAAQVSDVEGDAEAGRMAQRGVQALPLADRLDQHPRLGLEPER